MRWWLVVILAAMQSCGAKWHLNRAIAKDPRILDSVAVILDTTVITEIKEIKDTLILERVDTIKIEKDGVRVQLKRFYDTIMVDVLCPPDTIQIEKRVDVPKVVYKESTRLRLMDRVLIVIFCILVSMLVFKLLQ